MTLHCFFCDGPHEVLLPESQCTLWASEDDIISQSQVLPFPQHLDHRFAHCNKPSLIAGSVILIVLYIIQLKFSDSRIRTLYASA